MPLKVVKVVFTSLSNPKKMTIMKKKTAQSWGSGIRATARGKAMNANPGPIKTMQKKKKKKSFHIVKVSNKITLFFWQALVKLPT